MTWAGKLQVYKNGNQLLYELKKLKIDIHFFENSLVDRLWKVKIWEETQPRIADFKLCQPQNYSKPMDLHRELKLTFISFLQQKIL